MAEDDAMDDDRWLYGDDDDVKSPEARTEDTIEKTVDNIKRERTPDLDEIEAVSGLGVPSQIPTTKIVSTAPELQPKVTEPEKDELDKDNEDKKDEEEEDEDEEEASDDSDEDDVKITIGEILNPASAYARQGYGRVPSLSGPGGNEGAPPTKKIDLDAVPQLNGVPLLEVDIEGLADKPWRLPGADITDYFNYGFTEETWRLYCEKQRKMRFEVSQLNKLAVSSGITPNSLNLQAFDTMADHMVQQTMVTPTGFVTSVQSAPVLGTANGNDTDTVFAENKNDEIGTPPPDSQSSLLPINPILSQKPPILPPPGLPPPLHFHPSSNQDVAAAAAMAAMLTGGPPPPLRPPDFGFHPHMHGGMPPFPPPMPGDMRPPFPGIPPPFGLPGEHPRGPMHLDDRVGHMLPPDMMGFPPPWDPSLGPPPPEFLDGYPPPQDYDHGSRSPSHSSSSSQSSSVDRRYRRNRDRDKERYERSRHRGRSRSRDRHHRHREHREKDRERERDRERDRDREKDRERGRSDRHEKDRREHKRKDDRRHERSSRRHRSHTPDESTHRTPKEKKRSKSRSPS